MTDTLEDMLEMLLDGAVETLDISGDLQQSVIDQYEDVGSWLAERGNDWEINPQGSFLLGTVVRPNTPTGDIDIDLVCRTPFCKEDITQAQLKQTVGDKLRTYRRWKDTNGHPVRPSSLEERRRCWTFGYLDLGFHLDTLPCIDDPDLLPDGILLTDRQLRSWQHSNPTGYADWFRTRSAELETKLIELAASPNVADVPIFRVRSMLQRIVQILKWHAMLYFADDPDNKPPSILITTLAGRAYRDGADLFTATQRVVAGMTDHIEKRNGRHWVPNPAHPDENFADKWHEYPDRRKAFLAWHSEINTVLTGLASMRGQGLDSVVEYLSKAFSPKPIVASAVKYGQHQAKLRREGKLTVGATGLITSGGTNRLRDHQFYGTAPSTRR